MNHTTTRTEAAGKNGSKGFNRHLPTIARILLGLMFFVFGLNGFFNFMPAPKDMPPDIMTVLGAMTKAGYMTVVAGTEVVVGALLLSNRFVPLALALIAPIVVGILTFHIFLAPATIGPAIVVLVFELYLARSYRGAFRPMLAMRTAPGAGKP